MSDYLRITGYVEIMSKTLPHVCLTSGDWKVTVTFDKSERHYRLIAKRALP